jgi:hypothetical protein
MRHIGRPFMKKGRLRAFLKDTSIKELRITQLFQKTAKDNAGAAQGTHLQGH